jgi:hypothetical protein
MKVYWLSWVIRRINAEVAGEWPDGVKGWRSGYDLDLKDIWCARVEAESSDAAVETVLSMYGRFRDEVEWRFGPVEKPDGWWPEPSRFPQSSNG